MKIFDWELKIKNIIAEEYLKELKGYYILPFVPKDTNSAWAQFTIQTKKRNKVLALFKRKKYSYSNILSYSYAQTTSIQKV